MADISGFGIVVNIKASVTFPAGFQVSQFADDGDSINFDNIDIGDAAMGLNGDLITWSKPNPINVPLNVIPDGDDDKNLQVLFEANRAGKGKLPARDIITMTVVYPDGKSKTLTNGKLTNGAPSNSVTSAGRMKSKAYTFKFENIA